MCGGYTARAPGLDERSGLFGSTRLPSIKSRPPCKTTDAVVLAGRITVFLENNVVGRNEPTCLGGRWRTDRNFGNGDLCRRYWGMRTQDSMHTCLVDESGTRTRD